MKIYIPRQIENKIDKWLHTKHALVILGPRQVGKTTLLRHYAKKINARYLSLDEPEVRDLFIKDIKLFSQLYLPSNKKIILDEIQYAPEAGKLLKYLIDIKGAKILTAGSVSDEVRIKLSEYLVGRALFFTLFPFSFKEFLDAISPELSAVYSKYSLDLKDFSNVAAFKKLISKNLNITSKSSKRTVDVFTIIPLASQIFNQFQYNYLHYGGYPDVTLTKEKEAKLEILKNIINTVITKDVTSYFGYTETRDIFNFLKYTSGKLNRLFVFNESANYLGISLKKVKTILDILIRTYIAAISPAFSKNQLAEVKKAFKVYFIDTGIANYFNPTSEIHGGIEENYVFSTLFRLLETPPKYWRTKNGAEVDFVYYTTNNELIAIEVKAGSYSNLGKARYSFIRKYAPKYLVLLNKSSVGFSKIQNTNIVFWPYWLI